MELLPLGVGAAVGAGAGLVDREETKLAHSQVIYRAGGLLASLWAQHKGWGPPNVAPAAVAGFASVLAARTTILMLESDLHNFGMVRASGQKLTNATEAGALISDNVFVPVGRYTPATASGTCRCGMKH